MQPWPSCVSSDAPFFTSSQLPPQPLISFPPPLPPWEIPYQMGPPIFGTIRKQAQISHSWSSYLYHLRSIRDWLSKDQGPPLNTLSISNSIWNLNWKRFCPYSTIWTLSCKPRAFFRVLWATLLLKGLHVRNFPSRLYSQLLISSFLSSSLTTITSSSSVVSFMFSRLFITSSTITPNKRKDKPSVQDQGRE